MSVALEWTFENDLSGFTKNQNVKITREKIDSDHYLICQSQQNKSTPGIKLMDIILPNDEQEYCIEIDGFANNKKSFIWAINEQNIRLIKYYVFLPELLGTENQTEPVKAYFRLNEKNKEKKFCKLSIGVLIGGSAPTYNDIFFIKRVKLYQNTLDNQTPSEQNNTIQITRLYNSHDELSLDLPNPNRDNNTEMKPGEYALIKSNPNNSDHGQIYVAYADPDLNSAINLKYICNITGPDNIFTKSFGLQDNQIIPIYDEDWKAYQDIKDSELMDDFYDKNGETNRSGVITNKDGQTFIYFDKKGYIRWINPEKSEPINKPEDGSITIPIESKNKTKLNLDPNLISKILPLENGNLKEKTKISELNETNEINKINETTEDVSLLEEFSQRRKEILKTFYTI